MKGSVREIVRYFCGSPVSSVPTPNPGTPGGAPQTTTTAYNNLLQATSMLNPDGTAITSDYYLTGFDTASRLGQMFSFVGDPFPSWQQAAVAGPEPTGNSPRNAF